MRPHILVPALALAAGATSCHHTQLDPVTPTVTRVSAQEHVSPARPAVTPATVDFATQVKPILESRCQPCHFNGGIMYERLPFDRPETIETLGTKLFSRIKDENDQRVIREYLAQQLE